jgi:RNA polymerase sigma factor (sigma-70 family)
MSMRRPITAHSPIATGGERPFANRLLRRAARGERGAFEQIFRSYHQELYRYCLAIVRNREDAEDVLQATMAAALRALPGEDRDLALRPWLYRVAHNESISLLRSRRESPGRSEPEDMAVESAAHAAEERDRLRRLVADLQALPERQRSAIVMRELSGLSYPEIGAALESTQGAARQTVFEARSTLQLFQEGRDMQCERVCEAISARDGRRLRDRKIRAHLRVCDGCRAFEASIAQRRADLRALCPPLPALAAAGLMSGLAGGAAGGGAAAGGGVTAAGIAGTGLAGSVAAKGASLVAALAVAAGAADLSGAIDVTHPFGTRGADRAEGTSGRGAGEVGSGSEIAEPGVAAESGEGSRVGADGSAAEPGAANAETGGDPAVRPHGHSPATGATLPGNAGGNSGSTPGRTGSANGQAGASHGNSGSTHGNSESVHGNSGSTHGSSGVAHGSSSAPHGNSSASHGNPSASNGSSGAAHEGTSSANAGGAGTHPS